MFNLAATGSPLLDVTADPITVSVATSFLAHHIHLTLYVHRFLLQVIMTPNTVYTPIAVHSPASYFVQLSRAQYSPSLEPASFIDAYHSWLLIEILSSIGNHSMV